MASRRLLDSKGDMNSALEVNGLQSVAMRAICVVGQKSPAASARYAATVMGRAIVGEAVLIVAAVDG